MPELEAAKVLLYAVRNIKLHLLYARGPADVMVVAWNAWVLLYFDGMHINIEALRSTRRLISGSEKLKLCGPIQPTPLLEITSLGCCNRITAYLGSNAQ